MKKNPYVCQKVPLPKIPLCTLVIEYTEIYPITCKQSSSGKQAGLGGVSLFINQHDFLHSFVFLRRDLANFNRAGSSAARSRDRKCVQDLVFCWSDLWPKGTPTILSWSGRNRFEGFEQ